MNEAQEKVIKLLDATTPKEKLRQWIKGFIPQHYKRLSISRAEALELAKLGASYSLAYFGTKTYFTQSLLIGAVKAGKYKTIKVVTPSQYGKSWMCGQLALMLADEGRPVRVAGNDAQVTEIIMKNVADHIQVADASLKRKLLEPADKIERLQTGMSKKKVALKGGGLVEAITLGGNYKDALKSNSAVGRGGDYIVDEAALIPDEVFAEIGRREFSSDTGEKFLSFEISNPHRKGRFYDSLTSDNIPEDTLIVWMDARTALEEGRYKSKKQIIESEFFKEESTCKRYFLCELEDYSDKSLFDPIVIDDSKLTDDLEFFLGIDGAYKGKDGIEAALTCVNPLGRVRVLDHVTIDKSDWVDGETSEKIIDNLMKIIVQFKVKKICVDVGYGVYIIEGLAKRLGSAAVLGINFGGGTTKLRKDSNHYASVHGFNMRSELHIDLQQLIQSKSVTFTSKMHEALEDQMNAVQADRKPNGKIAIIPKDDIKLMIGKSPDELDSVLLSIHAMLIYKIENAGSAIYSGK